MRDHTPSAARRLAAYYGTGAATTFVTGAVAWVVAEAVYPGRQLSDPFLPLLGVAAVGGPVGIVIALAAWAARDLTQVHLGPMRRRWVNHRWLARDARNHGEAHPQYHCYVVPCGRNISTFQRILTGRCARHRRPR